MSSKIIIAMAAFGVSAYTSAIHAVNDAPADVDTVTVRTDCFENSGATEIPNCFDSMAAVGDWLKDVRLTGPGRPTAVDVGPGVFVGWTCGYSDVTVRGSGRGTTFFGVNPLSFGAAVTISNGCDNLSVQDLTIDGRLDPGDGGITSRGIEVLNLDASTNWSNVEVIGPTYGWLENIPLNASGPCPEPNVGVHRWTSSSIRATGGTSFSRAYSARCAESWFFGSEIEANVTSSNGSSFALEARTAEIHLYGSNARLLIGSGVNVHPVNFNAGGGSLGQFLIAALDGSVVHIHGTGLDVAHDGTGTVDMLYAAADSHFHANESGVSIHIGGTGAVQRLAGTGGIESPYLWGQMTAPPLSGSASGVGALISRNGADRYVETDCPLSGNCSAGGTYPHEMIYRSECTGTTADTGPWFDMQTQACRQ